MRNKIRSIKLFLIPVGLLLLGTGGYFITKKVIARSGPDRVIVDGFSFVTLTRQDRQQGIDNRIVEDFPFASLTSQDTKQGYDTRIVIKGHHEGNVPVFPSRQYVGGNESIYNIRIVNYQGNKEQILDSSPEKITSSQSSGKYLTGFYHGITLGDESYFVVLLALHSLPPVSGPYILKADLNRLVGYNIYQGGKAVATTEINLKTGSFSYTLPHTE